MNVLWNKGMWQHIIMCTCTGDMPHTLHKMSWSLHGTIQDSTLVDMMAKNGNEMVSGSYDSHMIIS